MTNPTAAPSPQQAVAEALRLAKDALEESHDDVVNTLNSYIDHPANAGKRRLIQNQIDAHCDAIKAVDAALAPQAVSEPPAGVAVKVDEALRRMYALRDEVWKSARGSEDVDVGGVMSACREAIEALATPTHQAAEPAASDMVLVPREPTEEIELAGEKALVAEFGRASRETWADVCGRVYRAMIADAAPSVAHEAARVPAQAQGSATPDDANMAAKRRLQDALKAVREGGFEPNAAQQVEIMTRIAIAERAIDALAATPSARDGDARDAEDPFLTVEEVQELACKHADFDASHGGTYTFNSDPECKFNIHEFARDVVIAAIAALAQGEAMP